MAWLTGWARRKPITLGMPAELQTDFPFPFRVAADAQIGALAQATGHDIRFTLADGTTLLNYERDVFSVTGGAATGLWHGRLPSWSAIVPQTVYCYYGKADAADVSSGPNTFDSNHVGVYHGGDGTTISVQDSSPAGNHGTNSGAIAGTGIAGGAIQFDDGTDSVAVPMTGLDDPLTVSAWLKITDGILLPSTGGFYAAIFGGDSNLLLDPASGLYVFYGEARTDRDGPAVQNAWHHFALRTSGGQLQIYTDAVQVGTDDTNGLSGGFTTLGKSVNTGYGTLGLFDEFRISNIARAPAWIAAEYGTIAAPATWQTWGAEEMAVSRWPWQQRYHRRMAGAR